MTTGERNVDRSHSISQLIARLKGDDPAAAAHIWERFFHRLLPLARARLRNVSDRTVDEEDVLVSVFDRFFAAAANSRFAKLNDRDDLLQILVMLTEHRVVEQYRRSQAKKRGGGKVGHLEDMGQPGLNLFELADADPSPQFVAAFNDSLSAALRRLADEKTREVAMLKMEGHEYSEIARRLGISVTSVERKMRVIREVWGEEFEA